MLLSSNLFFSVKSGFMLCVCFLKYLTGVRKKIPSKMWHSILNKVVVSNMFNFPPYYGEDSHFD